MIRINLLPFRAARKKENIRRQVSVFFLSLILVVIVAAWVNHLFSNKIKSIDSQIKETTTQVKKYNKINREIADIKKKLDVLNKKIKVIQSLDLTRKAPVELLNDMTQLVVEQQMWLTSLRERAGTIKVTGIALDNPAIAEFMTRIQSSGKYEDVQLLSINQDNSVKEMKLKKFDISFQRANTNKQSKVSKK
jgi:type IV pilus assembly protein PilN